MTTTANNNERKEFVNRISFSGSFYKFLGEDIKIGNQILYPSDYKFDYLIKLNDECKNGYLTFSFTGSIKIKKGNGRYYDFISGAIGDIITYFKPELSIFEKLHTCNHLGQPMYIDNIRYHINEGKSNQEISEMYNISDMKAIEILRNASDDKNLFYYLVFRLGVAENWENLANEAIQEIEKKGSVRYLQETYKEGIFAFTECKILSYLGICRIESKNGSQTEFLNVLHAYNTFRCSLGGIIECLNNKGLDVSIDKDNNIFCIPKDGDSLICEVRVWAYTKLLEINTKIGVHVEKDIDQNVSFSEFLNDCLLSARRHVTNKVFSFLEKEGYHWEQPNTQTFHLFKNGKEKAFKNEFEAYNFVQNKENESYFDFNVSDYTDDMIEVTGLDLESISSKVKQDSPKELKVIQDIKLYDKTREIVFTYDNGNTNTIIETTFNGDSVLQSVLQKINESM